MKSRPFGCRTGTPCTTHFSLMFTRRRFLSPVVMTKWCHTNNLFWQKYCRYIQLCFITTLDRIIQNSSSISSEPTKSFVNASRTTLAWEICLVFALIAIRRFIIGLNLMQSLGYLLLFMKTIFPRQTWLMAEVSPKQQKDICSGLPTAWWYHSRQTSLFVSGSLNLSNDTDVNFQGELISLVLSVVT